VGGTFVVGSSFRNSCPCSSGPSYSVTDRNFVGDGAYSKVDSRSCLVVIDTPFEVVAFHNFDKRVVVGNLAFHFIMEEVLVAAYTNLEASCHLRPCSYSVQAV